MSSKDCQEDELKKCDSYVFSTATRLFNLLKQVVFRRASKVAKSEHWLRHVYSSFRAKQLGPQRTDFHENYY